MRFVFLSRLLNPTISTVLLLFFLVNNSIIIWVGKGEGAFHVEIFYLFTGDWLLRINSLKLKSVKK